MKKNGFTLIELTLVLFILALAAHLGTRQLAAVKSARLRAAADRQLEEIADAVCRDSGGEVTGFLSDMGRLPLAVRSSDGASLCLAELYAKPEGVGDFKARPAIRRYLAEGAPDTIEDESVLIPCGWGGPYIRLQQGASRIRDPWGNPVENAIGADDGEARLLGEDLISAAADGAPVCAVRHLGSDGASDGSRPPVSEEAREATNAFNAASAELLVTFAPAAVSRIVLYAPLGDRITGTNVQVNAGEAQKLIEGISPGVRFVKAFFTNGTSRLVQTALRPGRTGTLDLQR